MMKLSVIIPTFNRKEILVNRTLPALVTQNFAPQAYEIIIVDDGSTDGTMPMLREKTPYWPGNIRCLSQSNKGPAAARNRGIRAASGKIIVIMGDDVIPASSNFLETHYQWHMEKFPEENIAVLGYVTWSPDLEITPFMRWLENEGTQFSYNRMKSGEYVDWGSFYTSNISLKKSWFEKTGEFFDERFPNAAYEDTEMGYRLHKRGFRIVFNREIVGYHFHPTNLENSLKRMKMLGPSLKILFELVPESLASWQRPWLRIRALLLANPIVIRLVFLPMAKLIERRFVISPVLGMVHEYYLRAGLRKACRSGVLPHE